MGRKSKLTESQWIEIEKRLITGEPRRALAREYDVSESAIRLRLSAQVEKVKEVTYQLVEAHRNLQSLPMQSQITAQANAAKLLALGNHLLTAAERGAATASTLSNIANRRAEALGDTLDETVPLDDVAMQDLKGIAVLTRISNESSEIGLNLIKANKEAVMPSEPAAKPKSLEDFYGT